MASNGTQPDAPKFYNYPDVKNVDIPYKTPDAPKNPVVRGLPLYYGASLYAPPRPALRQSPQYYY